VNVNTEAETS